MQAQGIRTGDRCDVHDAKGRVIGGWTATGDAVDTILEDGQHKVAFPVTAHDGQEHTAIFDYDEQVPLAFGYGAIAPRFPKGTPEYDAYAAELRAELAKFAAGEPPYNKLPDGTTPGAARAAGFGL